MSDQQSVAAALLFEHETAVLTFFLHCPSLENCGSAEYHTMPLLWGYEPYSAGQHIHYYNYTLSLYLVNIILTL